MIIIVIPEQTRSIVRVWSHLLPQGNLFKTLTSLIFAIRADMFKTKSLITFATPFKLFQDLDLDHICHSKQNFPILRVWSNLPPPARLFKMRGLVTFATWANVLNTKGFLIFATQNNMVHYYICLQFPTCANMISKIIFEQPLLPKQAMLSFNALLTFSTLR